MMKLKRPLFPLLMCMAIAAGCDIQERPLTDPVEIYEKAMMHIHEQSFIQAKPLLEKAASLFRETGKTDRLIETLVSLVQIDIKIGEYRPAFEALQEAAALMRKEGDVHGEIRLTLYEGDIYAAAKMFNLAIAKYRGALTSAAAFDDKNASIEAFLRIADLLAAGNDYERALEEYKEALTRAQAMDEYDRMAAALGGIGRIYRLQKRYAEAENSMSQAASLFDRVHDPVLIAQLQMETGILQASQNGVNQALQSFKEAVNTLRRGRTGREYESIILFRLGYLYEQNSRFLDAKRYYGEAIEIAGQLGDCITKNYISFFFQRCGFNSLPAEQQKHDRSRLRQEYEKIAREFQECRHVSGEGYMYIQIGLSYEQEGNYTKANEYYSRAVMIDQNTFVEYSDPELHVPYQVILGITPSHTEWYELLSASLLKLQKSEEALRVLEYSRIRQKACTFRDLDINLRNSKVKRQTMEVRKQIQRAQMLEAEYTARYSNSQYVAGRKEMYALREELEALKQSIRKGSWQVIEEYSGYETMVMPNRTDVAVLRSRIPNGSLAIEFMPTEKTLYIFALKNSRLIVRESQVKRDTLFKLMDEYQKLLQDPAVYSGEAGEASLTLMTRFAILSTQLYELIFRPIDDLIERNLIIVPDRRMEGFPFHAIERQDSKGNVKYLIEITSVDYLASLSSLRYRVPSIDRLKNVTAFGNPTGKNWSVDYELRDIRSFFKNANLLIGLDASWENLKSVRTDILQVSTGFTGENPEFPLGVVTFSDGTLAEQSRPLPFEKLSEIETIPVIVLSNQYGHGIGLSSDHALLLQLNGTADVFLNAWLADRKATKFFSEHFFTHIANGLAPGDAYRQALLNLIQTREVSQQHSWGQFFHFGLD